MDFVQVANMLRTAPSMKTLTIAAQNIQHVADIGRRESLGKIYVRRRGELKLNHKFTKLGE